MQPSPAKAAKPVVCSHQKEGAVLQQVSVNHNIPVVAPSPSLDIKKLFSKLNMKYGTKP